jgi:hypothetical protein
VAESPQAERIAAARRATAAASAGRVLFTIRLSGSGSSNTRKADTAVRDSAQFLEASVKSASEKQRRQYCEFLN